MPNPNLQSPTAKETAGAGHAAGGGGQQVKAQHQMPAAVVKEPPRDSLRIQPGREMTAAEERILAQARADLAKQQQQREQQARLAAEREQQAAVQQRLEQAHREQLHQQQQQRERANSLRASEQQRVPPAGQPQAGHPRPGEQIPPYMRGPEQMPPYSKMEGFPSQVSPHPRVPTPQQMPDMHHDKKGKHFFSLYTMIFSQAEQVKLHLVCIYGY